MKKLFVFFLMAVLPSLYINDTYAQDLSSASRRSQARVGRLSELCGTWKGQVGGVDAVMTLEMEETSSAVGELDRAGMIYFLHCFAEDMVTDDNITAGFDSDYQYCLLEQSGGETVGVFYMSLMSGRLKGVYLKDGSISPADFEMIHALEADEFTPENIEEDKWNTATYIATKEAFNSYISEFPSGKYVNEAKGKVKLLEAFEAEGKGDHYAALSALDKAENHIPLTKEAMDLRAQAEEGIAYDRFVNEENREEKIRHGMDFVNTYLSSSRRAEVSDQVAYLLASSPMYLAGTSAEIMLTYATTEKTREYVMKQTRQFAKVKHRRNRKSGLGFNGGIGVSLETPVESFRPVYGGHVFYSIGDYRNFMNFEMGVKYRYWSFVNVQDASDEFDFHQLRLFVAPKFNLVRQKKSPFYMYVAPEASYGYPIDMHATRMYEANSLTFGGRVGVGYGRFELAAMYSYDYWPMVKDTFTGSYSRTMAGIALTFCFSGSGRNK